MSLLSVTNIGKAFRFYGSEWHRFINWFGFSIAPSEERWVLKNISFEVQPGEAIGIIGQNGAGKSTLLKMITGTLQPTEGQLQVNGGIAAILELGMGFNPDFTGRQNANHGLGLMGHNHEEIEKIMPGLEAFADIGEYFDQTVRTYSSGMHMRVAFAVATAFRPEILIIDEALSVGDAAFQRKCFLRIEKYMDDGMALLFVSHDIESIKSLCTKAVFLKGGIQQGYDEARKICDMYEQDLFGSKKRIQEEHNQHNGVEEKQFLDPELLHVNELSYGDGRAIIEDVWLENSSGDHANIISTGSDFVLKYRVLFKSSVSFPVFAFLIKTMEGISLYGADTITLGEEVESCEAGNNVEITFRIENHLAAGTYFLNCGIRDESGEKPVFLHRRVDVAILKVTQQKETSQAGLVNLAAKFSAIKIN